MIYENHVLKKAGIIDQAWKSGRKYRAVINPVKEIWHSFKKGN